MSHESNVRRNFMSVQPWNVVEWTWCPCGVRAAVDGGNICHTCLGELRLHELDLSVEEQPETDR